MLTCYYQRGLWQACCSQTSVFGSFKSLKDHVRVGEPLLRRYFARPRSRCPGGATHAQTPHAHHSPSARLGYTAQLRPDAKCPESRIYSLFERMIWAASWFILISSRRGCCSECRWMSPLASPMERRRTPENTDTAIFDLERVRQQRAAAQIWAGVSGQDRPDLLLPPHGHFSHGHFLPDMFETHLLLCKFIKFR